MNKKIFTLLTINPGSTSTKIGVYKNENPVFETTIRHSSKSLEKFARIWDQYTFRKEEIIKTLEKNKVSLNEFDAIVGRGGLIRPIPSGVYHIDDQMIEDARAGFQGHHVSNLACVIAYGIGWKYSIPSFIVDPPAVDDMEAIAKISGNSEITRNSLFHALNIFATARHFSKENKLEFDKQNLIVAHLGGGITVAALQKGKAINVNNGLSEGPFSPERSGSLPTSSLIGLAFSGKYTKEQIEKLLVGKGGLVSYFGTNDASEIEATIESKSSEHHQIVFEAMAYQIAEEIAARASNLYGQVDAIILTGGLAKWQKLTELIENRVKFISKVYKYPGEKELEALALGGLRVLRGEESAKKYSR
ncbi:MAG: butyrate kinase [Oligoflexia bacterium]|nr:butyrate kinase [Oligoflexia bacterium]